jgi:hypothetical protein
VTNDHQHPDHEHYVRRVVLPSGKTIEVVYFEDQPAPDDLARPYRLHVCPGCSADLVYPLDWQEAGPEHWEMQLRCPGCEWTGSGVFSQSAVEAFEDELDRGTEALVGDLRRLARANMEEEIDRFANALEADAILPMDF